MATVRTVETKELVATIAADAAGYDVPDRWVEKIAAEVGHGSRKKRRFTWYDKGDLSNMPAPPPDWSPRGQCNA